MVLFPYVAQNEDELSLAEGQLITIITKDCEDKGWWKGEVDGRWVPSFKIYKYTNTDR